MTTENISHNGNLHNAKNAQFDDFYTPLSMIEEELVHYKKHFEGKTVFCNCDDPFGSNFTLYFLMHFNSLKLKRLITTGYAISQRTGAKLKSETYCLDVSDTKHFLKTGQKDLNASDALHMLQTEPQLLKTLYGDQEHLPGDFRSNESIELLMQADIIVCNPPFSLFLEYITLLEKYEKKYLFIGDINQATYKEFFPMLRDGKVWMGATMKGTGSHWFAVPDSYENDNVKVVDGVRMMTNGRACWWTNLDYKSRHTLVPLGYKYFGHEKDYPKYDNYDAIDIGYLPSSGKSWRGEFLRTPYDYPDVMGIPITAFGKICPEQFEIVGWSRHNDENMDGGYWNEGTKADATVNKKIVYRRLLIKNRQPNRNDWDAWQREIDKKMEDE